MVKSQYFILLFIVLLSVFSCHPNLDLSLQNAENNRSELEKVLNHFENNPIPLKYQAAEFLIENMLYCYSYNSIAANEIDELYLNTSNKALNKRTEFFNKKVDSIKSSIIPAYDINLLNADYLIKAIDDACDMWYNSPWHEQYDKEIFFDYVLPYRIEHEPLSDWRQTISEEFPLLTDSVVLSRRGMQFESEDAECFGCIKKENGGASGGIAEMMPNAKSSVSFVVNTERNTRKRLILKYAATPKLVKATVCVNGKVVDTLSLAPSRNMDSFVEKWHQKPYTLKKGKNVITFGNVSDTLCIDYIQLGAVEEFKRSQQVDFSSSYYNIVNKASGHYVTFDTAMTSKVNQIELKPYNKSNKAQLLRLVNKGYPLWEIGYYDNSKVDMCLEMTFGTPRILAPDSLITAVKYENRPFMQWAFIPQGNDCYRIVNKHSRMFLDTRIDEKTGKEVLVQNPYREKNSQIWVMKRQGINPFANKFFKINSAISEAMRVLDLTHSFEYYIHNGPFLSKGSSIIKTRSGKCADETAFSVMLCRYLGIPAAYEFTPHWGNRAGGHSWSVLIDTNGKNVPFYSGNMPGDTAHYFYSYIKPKVFRYRYRLNDEIVEDLKGEESVPKIFKCPRYTDVTDEYYTTTDVERTVPKEYRDRNVAYICVFDNRNWVPVFYGNISWGKVKFKSMGRGIVYIAALYENGRIVPFGNPFVITQDGKVKDIAVDTKKKAKMTLLRKYPFMGAQDFFNNRMNNGQFQGANKADFSDCVTLYTHKGITNGNWYNIPVKNTTEFKYLRYIGAKGSFCNINELEFYDAEGKKVEGTIIGTQGESWCPKERVFDGDILTGFGGNTPDGNWVGLKLAKPVSVSRIKYIGRNDGNGIEKGDKYELYCWSAKGSWELIASHTATDNVLNLSNIHPGGLYILKDITKGVEERIFTYENGKQVWW